MRIVLLCLILVGCESIPVGKLECVAAYRQASADNYKGHSPSDALMNAVGAGHAAFDKCMGRK